MIRFLYRGSVGFLATVIPFVLCSAYLWCLAYAFIHIPFKYIIGACTTVLCRRGCRRFVTAARRDLRVLLANFTFVFLIVFSFVCFVAHQSLR